MQARPPDPRQPPDIYRVYVIAVLLAPEWGLWSRLRRKFYLDKMARV